MAGPPAIGALHREWMDKTKKPHVSVDEKYDLLNVRDKILRLVSKSQTSSSEDDSDNAPLLRGTCVEMCPEKERYERIKQERVGFFEQEKYMVKDFSRQAADQEMPLPSELRTAEALQTTMHYLLREIIANPMEIPESSLCAAGWYDFVWRRIRAIRKEITQQRLAGLEIAFILEQMCRFHIVSFHMFCEVERNQFDSKLNLENLNDCLAGLGRVYQQMERNGEYSPNMAEFHAYEMFVRTWTDRIDLVKVTMELTKFEQRKEVAFVKRAISSVNNKSFGDYVTLLRQADYCMACLMHYYLPFVQASALKALYLSCGGGRWRSPKSSIGLRKLQLMLGIETDMEMLRFCTYFKLEMDRENGVVSFPTGFVPPDPKLYQRTTSRHITLQGNIAEIVAKSQLDDIPVPDIVEICSFDDNGSYVGIDPFEEAAKSATVQGKDVAVASNFKLSTVKKQAAINRIMTPSAANPLRFSASPRQHQNVFQFPAPAVSSSLPGSKSPNATGYFRPILPATPSGTIFLRSKRSHSDFEELDQDVVEIPRTPTVKRLHTDDYSVSIPSRRPSVEILRPLVRTPSKPADHPSEDTGTENVEEVYTESRRYPHATHPVLLQARCICQAAGTVRAVLRGWFAHTRAVRSPAYHFGDPSPTEDQIEFADRLRYHEERQLLWSKFPLRKMLDSPNNCDISVCTVLIMVVSAPGADYEPLSRWLRVKFGNVDDDTVGPVHIYSHGNGQRCLRVIFVDALRDRENIDLKSFAKDVNGAVFFCQARADLEYGKEKLDEIRAVRNNRPQPPVVVFCSDSTVTRDEISALSSEELLQDYFVPYPTASLPLACAVWESFLWIVDNRIQNPLPTGITLSSILSGLFGQFVKIYRIIQREIRADLSKEDTIWIWNRLVETSFVDVIFNVAEDQCCDELLEMIEASTLPPYLKFETWDSLEDFSVYKPIFPFSELHELDNAEEKNRMIFGAISQKLVAVMTMCTVHDPVSWRYAEDLADFELILLEFMEKFGSTPPECDQNIPTEISAENEISGDEEITETQQLPVITDDELEIFRQKKLAVTSWLAEVTNLLDSVEMI